MSELYESFLPELDWKKGEIRPDGKKRIMEEGRAAFQDASIIPADLLMQLEAKRSAVELSIRQSNDPVASAVADRLSKCNAEWSCCSNSCPLCRLIPRRWSMHRTLMIRQQVPVTRVRMDLGTQIDRPLHGNERVDVAAVKNAARRQLRMVGAADRPWFGLIDIEARLIYPEIHHSIWTAHVRIFGIGVSEEEVEMPLRNLRSWSLSIDVRDVDEDDDMYTGDETAVHVHVTDDGKEPEKRLELAIETEVAMRRSSEDIFDSVFAFGAEVLGT